MQPAISASLEPGLERGVPWGRDLYTFVTSAAGHLMRTLQKPKKNRPSKRQVNCRFLHNMIQRCVEAGTDGKISGHKRCVQIHGLHPPEDLAHEDREGRVLRRMQKVGKAGSKRLGKLDGLAF